MRLIRTFDTAIDAEVDADEPSSTRFWHWFTRANVADDDGSRISAAAVSWDDHTSHVVEEAQRLGAAFLADDPDIETALTLAAQFHDLGKKRIVWQRSIGNENPTDWHAKSGPKWKRLCRTLYRHEFGSLLDLQTEAMFQKQSPLIQELILHLVAVHHGYGRPHFPPDRAFDPQPPEGIHVDEVVAEIPRRFARLQHEFGRWGLAWLESLLRAADATASRKEAGNE